MWEPGDLALCISKPEGDISAGFDCSVGGIYTVLEFEPANDLQDWDGLNFVEDYSYMEYASFDAKHFSKINPLTEEQQDEFLNDIRVPELV